MHRYDASNCAVCKFTFRQDLRSFNTVEIMKPLRDQSRRKKEITALRKNAKRENHGETATSSLLDKLADSLRSAVEIKFNSSFNAASKR